MAIVYSIQPNPHWVIIDNFSKLPNGAAIYTYSSLDPSTFKPAFEDAGGTIPYGQPIVGFGNGTMPPIYWEFDDSNPDDLYYIRVYDSDDPATQNFLWDFDGLSGASGGGGGTITVNNDIQNLITNGAFYRNSGTISPVPEFSTLAPSNNAGLVGNLADVNGPAAPDIIFAKSNITATDSISFPLFSPIGISSLAPNPTPLQYFNYTCTGAGSGETYKYIQFPIGQGLQNFSGQTISIKFYARLNSGTNNVTLNLRQFFGNGGSPSADVLTPVSGGPIGGLTNTWNSFIFNAQVVPSIAGKILGTCGNDGLFLQFALPLSSLVNIDIVFPAVYLINALSASAIDFHNNDQINAIINSPRTGDTRTSLNDVILGWANMNDGMIGSASSNATTRANLDTFPLFDVIWNNFKTVDQTLAPMYTSAGAPVAYGVDSFTDFNANRQLSLTRNLGRVMIGALPVSVTQAFTNTGNVMTVLSTASFYTGVPVVVSGGGLPSPLVAGTTYYAIMLSSTTMSLATTVANAIAGTAIVLTTNASGNVIVPAHGLGSFGGEETHTQTINEMAAHNHPGSTVNAGVGAGTTGFGENLFTATTHPVNVASQGGGAPFNVMQPFVGMNVFIKL